MWFVASPSSLFSFLPFPSPFIHHLLSSPSRSLYISKISSPSQWQSFELTIAFLSFVLPSLHLTGPLIDFCLGPHIPHTGKIKAFAVTKASSSYFLGDANNETLQRIYGISFPDSKQMTEYKKWIEEAEKRNHRKIGKVRDSTSSLHLGLERVETQSAELTFASCFSSLFFLLQEQELFMFHELSPGSPFFLPHGMRIYNALIAFIKEEYRDRGYEEGESSSFLVASLVSLLSNSRLFLPPSSSFRIVISPNMFNVDLWKQSGHYDNYKDDMFLLNVEKTEFALKPMNCPGHCLIFDSRKRSHKELPIRMAEFGVLHRNEASGSLGGLSRVRRFVQDDSHIFCMPEQVSSRPHLAPSVPSYFSSDVGSA